MTRVWRFNARKDCLVCIVGVIAGGHYDQGRDLNTKLLNHIFIFTVLPVNTVFNFDLPDCTSKLMMMMMMIID